MIDLLLILSRGLFGNLEALSLDGIKIIVFVIKFVVCASLQRITRK